MVSEERGRDIVGLEVGRSLFIGLFIGLERGREGGRQRKECERTVRRSRMGLGRGRDCGWR